MPPKEHEEDIWVPCFECTGTPGCPICDGFGGFWIDDPYADEMDAPATAAPTERDGDYPVPGSP